MTTTPTLQELLQTAISALQSGRPETACNNARQAINRGANNATAWGVLALACRDLQDWPAALEAANQSLAHEPRNPRALVVKGDAYFAKGDRRAAASFYREALRLAGGTTPTGAAADLLADLERAERRCSALESDFAAHVEARIADLVAPEEAVTPGMREAVDLLLGRRQLFLPQPRHIYFPGLPNREFYDPTHFDWVAEVEATYPAILEEARDLLVDHAAFDPYLGKVDNRPTYDAHGMQDSTDWSAYYLWYNGEPVPEHQARCPATTAAMGRVPLVFSGQRCPNVLFSRLRPGAKIAPHHGMINTRLICHLPLVVPPGCGFRVGNDRREWQPGKVWLFDDTVEHEAWNDSTKDRLILIFEVWKPELVPAERELVSRLLEAVDNY